MQPLVASGSKNFDGTVESPKRASQNPGDVLLIANLYDDAMPFLEKRLRENPEDWLAITNYAACRLLLGNIDEAIEMLAPLAEKYPDNIPVVNDLGLAHAYRGEHAKALELYKHAYNLDPQDKTTMLNLGSELMKSGDWPNGQWLWEGGRYGMSWSAPTGMEVYTDQSLEGKKLLVLREGGYGDVFQFVRFMPILKEWGCDVTMTVWNRQISLLRDSGVAATMVPATEIRSVDPKAFDYVTSICSIPFVARAQAPYWPGEPYLKASYENMKLFRNRLVSVPGIWLPNKPKVGLCWAAEEAGGGRHIRSIPNDELAALADVQVNWINLCPRREAPSWIIDPGPQADWAEAAGLIANLDLVISVDTAIGHLAGAMGKPVWSLLPCFSEWRWGTPDKPTPWYPTQNLFFNLDTHHWHGLVDGVAKQLASAVRTMEQQKAAECK